MTKQNKRTDAKGQENLAAAADAHSLNNIPLSKAEFLELIRAAYPQLADQVLDGKRISPGTFNEVKSWVEEFPSFLKRHKLSGKWIINADETRLVIGPGKVTPNVMASARRDKVSQKEGPQWQA
eukprot:m51a1_g14429 hypothetical protein (124) ;mRNA; f:515757-518289